MIRLKTTAFLLLSGIAAGCAAENRLRNPGFEEEWQRPETHEAAPAKWSVRGNSFGRYQIPARGHNIPDRPDGKKFAASGNHAVELAFINGPAGENAIFQEIYLNSGEYRFTGKVRTVGNDGAKLRLFVFAGEQKTYLDKVPSNHPEYTDFSVDFTINKSGSYPVGIGIYRSERGYLPYSHWDDLSFAATRLTPEKDSLAAVDSDYDGWTDELEKLIGTDPFNPDSNNSGILDSQDPNPLLKAVKPAVNYIRGEKRYSSVPVPRNFYWNSLLFELHKDPAEREKVLKKFENWNMYPSMGHGSGLGKNNQELFEYYRKRNIEIDGWQCVHEPRSFGKILGEDARFHMDNPEVNSVFAVDQLSKKFQTDYISQIDENTWAPTSYNREQFVAFLIRKGYKPTDFGAARWNQLIMPDITRPKPDSKPGRLLLKELQYYAEECFLNHFKGIAFATRQGNPNVKINLGIFAPWALGYGYYGNLPVTSFWQIAEAELTEWDFYDWVYTGHIIPWNNFNIVEAGNQYLTDLLRIPTQLTFSLEFEKEGRDANFYRLIMMSNLLLVDNITGVTFFYYGVKTDIGPANIDNPRWAWVGEGVKTAGKVYPNVHKYKENHRILIVSDDPSNLSEGSMFYDNGERKPQKEFFKGIRYGWYNRAYQHIAKAGYDANFCIPRMVPGLDLDKFDVIVVDADYINDYPLERLKKWAADGKGKLYFHPKAALLDELSLPRAEPWKEAAARAFPENYLEVRKQFKEAMPRSVFTPEELPPEVRINVKGNAEGSKVMVIANYSDKPQNLSVRLKGKHRKTVSLLGTSKSEMANGGLLKATIQPWQFEVLELSE